MNQLHPSEVNIIYLLDSEILFLKKDGFKWPILDCGHSGGGSKWNKWRK